MDEGGQKKGASRFESIRLVALGPWHGRPGVFTLRRTWHLQLGLPNVRMRLVLSRPPQRETAQPAPSRRPAPVAVCCASPTLPTRTRCPIVLEACLCLGARACLCCVPPSRRQLGGATSPGVDHHHDGDAQRPARTRRAAGPGLY
jgi:hypothetical protein